jgi:hypothetical protein
VQIAKQRSRGFLVEPERVARVAVGDARGRARLDTEGLDGGARAFGLGDATTLP